jgi:hypothetical protein
MERPGDVAELLRFLVRELDEAYESGQEPVAPPALLRLDGADVATAVGGIDLHVKPMAAGHPLDVLGGFTAPPEWFGFGIVSGGWSEEPGHEGARVRLTWLMTRDGTETTGVHEVGNALHFLESRCSGQVPDCIRRVLGLPTDPPEVTLDEWMAQCWLQIILAQPRRGRRGKLAWREAAALHPAIGVTRARPDTLASVAPDLAAAMRWERFRQLGAQTDHLVAWMDEGMFARYEVGGRPPVSELVQRARTRLTPAARARVEETLAGWGLLDEASVA